MLLEMLKYYDYKLPKNANVVFCNTGKERPETLDFIHEFELRYQVPIVWLEYRYRKNAAGRKKGKEKSIAIVTDYKNASRRGEPFESLISGKSYLPNTVQRICTSELKVATVSRWARREKGITEWYSILGIRADEESRLLRMSKNSTGLARRNEMARLFPMVAAGVTKKIVDDFWAKHNFDLGISSYAGNCDLCFMKRKGTLTSLLRKHPEWADWWSKMEEMVSRKRAELGREDLKKQEIGQFHKDFTMQELVKIAQSQHELPIENTGGIDCFCTD